MPTYGYTNRGNGYSVSFRRFITGNIRCAVAGYTVLYNTENCRTAVCRSKEADWKSALNMFALTFRM
jgi:hypothetical protein